MTAKIEPIADESAASAKRSYSVPAAEKALDVLEFMAQPDRDPDNLYLMLVRSQRTALAGRESSYVFHEFLEEVNQPVYYHDFLGRIATAGLRAVADAEYAQNTCVAPESVRKTLVRMSDDPARPGRSHLDVAHGAR